MYLPSSSRKKGETTTLLDPVDRAISDLCDLWSTKKVVTGFREITENNNFKESDVATFDWTKI
jgi:hypothetical protein